MTPEGHRLSLNARSRGERESHYQTTWRYSNASNCTSTKATWMKLNAVVKPIILYGFGSKNITFYAYRQRRQERLRKWTAVFNGRISQIRSLPLPRHTKANNRGRQLSNRHLMILDTQNQCCQKHSINTSAFFPSTNMNSSITCWNSTLFPSLSGAMHCHTESRQLATAQYGRTTMVHLDGQ